MPRSTASSDSLRVRRSNTLTRGIRVNDVCPGMIQTPMSDKMIAEGQGPEHWT